MVGYVSYATLFCLFDQFLISGLSIITKYLLTICGIGKDILHCAKTKTEFISVINYLLLSYPDPATVMNKAIKIKVREIQLNPPFEEFKTFIPFKLNIESVSVDYSTFELLWQHLPRHKKVLEPIQLFSSITDGTSFQLLYNQIKEKSSVLFFIQTKTKIVGAFFSHPIKIGTSYHGNTEDFVFEITSQKVLSSFHWSCKNTLFLTMKNDMFFIGGGNEGPALLIREDMTISSFASETFLNPSFFTKDIVTIKSIEIFTLQ